MRISKFILQLQEILKEKGDILIKMNCMDEFGWNYHADPSIDVNDSDLVVIVEEIDSEI